MMAMAASPPLSRMFFSSCLMGMLLISQSGVTSFVAAPTLRKRLFFLRSLKSSYDDNPLDDMRKLLESSWNADTMGAVPTNPEIAAIEAATCIKSARENGQSLVSVNLLLPSYDVLQGPNVYDHVLAVEFCIALSHALEDQACILVRDGKTFNSISRVLEARERDLRLEEELAEDDVDDDIDVGLYDGFASSGSIGDDETIESTKQDEESSPAGADVDVFREQLMARWDGPTTGGKSDAATARPIRDSTSRDLTPESNKKENTKTFCLEKMYRLASLFGDAIISRGPDMVNQAVKAVSVNALPTEDEETIIILSAVQNEEVVAVRSLAAKYKATKNIILVNCQFEPLPRELARAITVYSVLPLVAKPVIMERNAFGKLVENQEPPKVVVMRRYPKEWEVYVDANGGGFELADIARASQVGKKGPPMEWIAACVKRHLQSKVGG
jgi:hypothetical protein